MNDVCDVPRVLGECPQWNSITPYKASCEVW